MKILLRLFSLAAAGSALLSLSACGRGGGSSADLGSWVDFSVPASSAAREESAAASSTAPTPESSAAPSPASSAAPTSDAPAGASAPSETSAPAPQAQTARVTIIEGDSLAQIAERLERAGVCGKSALMAAAGSGDFSGFELVGTPSEHRCYALEGYLFPDTYEFYLGEDPASALRRMLSNTQTKITAADRSRAAELGFTVDEILTLASIIEKECGNARERGKISGVFHNRLKQGKKLESDATVYYIERYVKPNLSGDINRYNAYYNTYKCAALPAGPICNPGAASIHAALYPEETDALFFVTDAQGNYYYAETFEEHKANCERAGVSAPQSD